jgi:hypothetical protein
MFPPLSSSGPGDFHRPNISLVWWRAAVGRGINTAI